MSAAVQTSLEGPSPQPATIGLAKSARAPRRALVQAPVSGVDVFRPPILVEPVLLRHASLLWLRTGTVRAFGVEDIGDGGLVAGWAQSEPGHVWNDGIDATLCLAARGIDLGRKDRNRNENIFELEIAAEPYVTRQNPTQDVTLYLNGARAGFWRLAERRVMTMRAWIDPAWWRHKDGTGHLRAVFHVPQSVSPAELGDGQDVRCLGLSFRTIALHAVGEG